MRLSRRHILRSSVAMAAAAAIRSPLVSAADVAAADSAETLAGRLHASLTRDQRAEVCFPWDHVHPKFGLLRTRVGNNWNATAPEVKGDFFSKEQQQLVREIFERLIDPDWHARFDKQLEDDAGGGELRADEIRRGKILRLPGMGTNLDDELHQLADEIVIRPRRLGLGLDEEQAEHPRQFAKHLHHRPEARLIGRGG